jgi:RNase P protein component
MLDKTQASVAQSTVVNATNLACAIAAHVLGVSIPDQLHGESVTRNTIKRIVLDDIRQTTMAKEKTHAL